jgi:hypothetical protein
VHISSTCKVGQILGDSLPIDMLLFAVSVLVIAQSSSEMPEGLINNPVLYKCTLHKTQRRI